MPPIGPAELLCVVVPTFGTIFGFGFFLGVVVGRAWGDRARRSASAAASAAEGRHESR